MKKIIYLLMPFYIMTVVFPISNVFAQVPVNKMSYVSKSPVANEKDSDRIKAKTPVRGDLDKYFVTAKGVDTAIKTKELQEDLDKMNKALEEPEKNINPYLANMEGNLLDLLQTRIKELRDAKVNNAETTRVLGASITAHASTVDLDKWVEKVKKIKKGYYAVNRIYGNPKFTSRFFPAKNATAAAMIYQRYNANLLQVGSNISLFGWNNRGTVNPELMSFFGGPFRFAVNTLVSATEDGQDKTELAQLRTLSGNGGNVVLSMYVPAFHTSTQGVFTFAQFSLKGATEMPILGSPFKSDTIFGNINLGFDFNFSINLPILGGSSLYYYARPAAIYGSKPYLTALQSEEQLFALFQHMIGLDIKNVGRIGFSLPTGSNISSLRNDSFLLSFQLVPTNIKKD